MASYFTARNYKLVQSVNSWLHKQSHGMHPDTVGTKWGSLLLLFLSALKRSSATGVALFLPLQARYLRAHRCLSELMQEQHAVSGNDRVPPGCGSAPQGSSGILHWIQKARNMLGPTGEISLKVDKPSWAQVPGGNLGADPSSSAPVQSSFFWRSGRDLYYECTCCVVYSRL